MEKEGVRRAGRGNPGRPARIAIQYWNLPADARLRDVILAVRADEAGHRDVNHRFADELSRGKAERVERASSHDQQPRGVRG